MKHFLLLVFILMIFGCSGNFSCYYAKPQENHDCLGKCLSTSCKCKDNCELVEALEKDTRYQRSECKNNCDKVYAECFSTCK